MGQHFWKNFSQELKYAQPPQLAMDVDLSGRRANEALIRANEESRRAQQFNWQSQDRARAEDDRQKVSDVRTALGQALQQERPDAEVLPGNYNPEPPAGGPEGPPTPPEQVILPGSVPFSRRPTSGELLQSFAGRLTPEGVAVAQEESRRLGLKDQREVPAAVTEARKARLGQLARVPGASADVLEQASAAGVKDIPKYNPNYAKEQAFNADVGEGKYGDPSTVSGRLAIADAALTRGLKSTSDAWKSRSGVLREQRLEATTERQTQALDPLRKRVDGIVASGRLTANERDALASAMDVAEADPKQIGKVGEMLRTFGQTADRRALQGRRLDQIDQKVAAVRGTKDVKAREAKRTATMSEIRKRMDGLNREVLLEGDEVVRQEKKAQIAELGDAYQRLMDMEVGEKSQPSGTGAGSAGGESRRPTPPTGSPTTLLPAPAGGAVSSLRSKGYLK